MENICLKWNEFETNIRQAFMGLREKENLFDVTLATDDGQQIKAHKIILSAGSNFFSEIFRKTKHPSPFIYLKETFIAQKEVRKFLETAQELQVKGLLSIDEYESGQNHTVKTTLDADPQFTEIETDYRKNEDPIKQESMFDSSSDTFDNNDVAPIKMEDNLVLNTNLDLQIEQMIEKNEGLWQCKVCGKTSRPKNIIKRHAETHIEGVSHSCHICNKTLSNRPSLKVHIINAHSELSFTCNNCGNTGMTKMAYKKHKSNCYGSAGR